MFSTAYMDLVRQNTENYRYHAGLQAAVLGLDPPTAQAMLELKGCDLPSNKLQISDAMRETLTAAYESLLQVCLLSLGGYRCPFP
jgi:hypothetical protein